MNKDSELNSDYWNKRWMNNETGWDIGAASPVITSYMSQYPNKNASILIPGCGNAYEAEFLVNNGFNNITLIDFAPKAIEAIKKKFENKPQVKILCENFFNYSGIHDLIIEQTFFCAIEPAKRNDYAIKASSLLHANGKLTGVLFNKQFDGMHPPYGGSAEEYRKIFEPYFIIQKMENCYNSILPRQQTELFVCLIKKPS